MSTRRVLVTGVIRRGAEHDPAAFADTVDINLTGLSLKDMLP